MFVAGKEEILFFFSDLLWNPSVLQSGNDYWEEQVEDDLRESGCEVWWEQRASLIEPGIKSLQWETLTSSH